MEKQNNLTQKIDELTKRVEELEKQISKLAPVERHPKIKKDDDKYYTTDVLQKFFNGSPYVEPDELKENTFTFAGNYASNNGSVCSKFGACISSINCTLNDYDSLELAKIIDAYANEERLNILKLLLQNKMTAKELMDKLNFRTTGKLYHHLSILENLGIIFKKNEVYHIQGYAIGASIMILDSSARLIRRFEKYNKTNQE